MGRISSFFLTVLVSVVQTLVTGWAAMLVFGILGFALSFGQGIAVAILVSFWRLVETTPER